LRYLCTSAKSHAKEHEGRKECLLHSGIIIYKVLSVLFPQKGFNR
jgi:hypothetical protein